MGLLGAIAIVTFMPDQKKEPSQAFNAPYQAYVERGKSVFGAIPQRFSELGLEPIGWAYQEYGLLGAGLGFGSQGTQHFGVAMQGAAEGGLGKIWLELGAPGFVVIVWLGWAMMRRVWDILKLVSRQSVPLSRMAFGLTSFLVANIAAFAVATQVYGDIFILLLLGTTLGVLLAMPTLVERALQKRILGVEFLQPHTALMVARRITDKTLRAS